MVKVQVEFSLVAWFWVGITYISNEPGDAVYKKLMALVKVKFDVVLAIALVTSVLLA